MKTRRRAWTEAKHTRAADVKLTDCVLVPVAAFGGENASGVGALVARWWWHCEGITRPIQLGFDPVFQRPQRLTTPTPKRIALTALA